MSHLTADAPAIALGAGVGLAAGTYTPWAVRRAQRDAAERDRPDLAYASTPGWLIAILAAAFGSLVGARFGLTAGLPAYLYLAAIAPTLAAVDAAVHRLPDRVLLPAYPVGMVLLAFAAWRMDDGGPLWRALLAGALLFVLFLAVALVAPTGSLGFGDVKLSGLVGGYLGFLGWNTLLRGMTIAFVSAAVYVLARRLVRRDQHGQLLPLGPTLLFGTLVAVIAS